MERKLAAIFAADVVGYTRMIRADEEGTLQALRALREELIDPKISEHRGRIVKLMGDGILAEFASVVDAVACSADVQHGLAERNSSTPEDGQIVLRIGINLGDVVIDGDDIQGDGVNVAARLETLSAPGGMCISDAVHEQVRDRLDLKFENLGGQDVKNVDRPVQAWGWTASGPDAAPTSSKIGSPLAVPGKPSIAVLPFTNMSGDPEQEFLADGLAEDIITALSKISEMFVIARNSTFAYKGKSPDIRQVAEELGVRSVLEGSVRRAGDRVRITAQLIDAETGSHIWAERYDRQIVDIFDLQDEITQEIVTALEVKMTKGEQIRVRRRQTNNIDAWDAYVQAQAHLLRFTREDNTMAQELGTRAVNIDPEFAAAHTLLAFTHITGARLGWAQSAAEALERGDDAVRRALAIDENDADAHAMLGSLRNYQRRYDESLEAGRRAIELAPSAADHYVWSALTLNLVGRAEEAANLIEKAMRLSPFYPGYYLGIIAQSYRLLGRLDDAIAADKERLAQSPGNAFSDFRLAAAVYSELGDEENAKFHVQEALRKNPHLSLEVVRQIDPYADECEMEHFLDLLRKAGLPE
ncbi:MAG: adenylate/guanylate cyclase domain-containing protein [Alphaproteobacteria bacterium]|nr:adenylate/guanylate cyclase domain-containing protein [Alphaproteobacteria bacterium]